MSPKYYSSVKDFMKMDDYDRLLQIHFDNHEKQVKSTYKRKIESLSEYYNNLRELCNFTTLSRDDLFKKLREKRSQFLAQGVSLTPSKLYSKKLILYQLFICQRSRHMIEQDPRFWINLDSTVSTTREN